MDENDQLNAFLDYHMFWSGFNLVFSMKIKEKNTDSQSFFYLKNVAQFLSGI